MKSDFNNTAYAVCIMVYLAIVVVAPYIVSIVRKYKDNSSPLNLPKGSVRGMIALSSVGVFLYVVGVGALVLPPQSFEIVSHALEKIAFLIVGFYFGSRINTHHKAN